MEKHSAYCALMRLGLKVPETILVPYKNPVDNVRWAYTSARYNRPFDLKQIANELGYPLYMKPFDGGGWRGVSRIDDEQDLVRAYDASGEMLMHLQATIDYDVFARALSIGPETMVMNFRPDEPMHNRYAVSHGFLSARPGGRRRPISRIVNALFGWEFNSREMLVKGDEVYPIDYANACPDVAVTSLHYYFPWAIKALVRWSAYSPRHRPTLQTVDLETRPVLRRWRTTRTSATREARRLPRDRRRVLRDDRLRASGAPAPARFPGRRPRVVQGRGVPPDAADHGRPDLPRARAGPASWRTSRACSACGSATRRRGWPPNVRPYAAELARLAPVTSAASRVGAR